MEKSERQTPPVSVGAELELEVKSFGVNGDPVLKVEKYVLFLKLPKGREVGLGDELEVRVTKVLPNFGFAELVFDGKF
jgi:predicted RNA-binding protein with TRAM domain